MSRAGTGTASLEPGLPRSSHHLSWETLPEGHRDGIGVLEVVNKTLTQAHYTEEDLKNLETLAWPRAGTGTTTQSRQGAIVLEKPTITNE